MAEENMSENDSLMSSISVNSKRTDNSTALMIDINKGSNIERLLSDLRSFARTQSNYLKLIAPESSAAKRIKPDVQDSVAEVNSSRKDDVKDSQQQSIIALATRGALEGVLGKYGKYIGSIFDMFNDSKNVRSSNSESKVTRNSQIRPQIKTDSDIIKIDYNVGSNLGNAIAELKSLSETQVTYLKQIVDYNNELKNALIEASVSDVALSNRSSVGGIGVSGAIAGAGVGAGAAGGGGGIIDTILGSLDTILELIFAKKIFDVIREKISGEAERGKSPEEKAKTPEEKTAPEEKSKAAEESKGTPEEKATANEKASAPKEGASVEERAAASEAAPKEGGSVSEGAPEAAPNKSGASEATPETAPKEGSTVTERAAGPEVSAPKESASVSEGSPRSGSAGESGGSVKGGQPGGKSAIAKGSDIFAAAIKRFPRFGTFLKFVGEVAIAYEVATILLSDDTITNKAARLTGPIAGFFATGPGIAAGAALGAAMGVESGPGLILTGLIGGGLAYFAADWLATQIALWLVNEAFEKDYEEGPTVMEPNAPKNRGDVAKQNQSSRSKSAMAASKSSIALKGGFDAQFFADTTANIPDAILDPISKQGLINSRMMYGPDRDRQNIRPSDRSILQSSVQGNAGIIYDSIHQNPNVLSSPFAVGDITRYGKVSPSPMITAPTVSEKTTGGSNPSVVVLPGAQANAPSSPNIVNSHNNTTTIIQKAQDPAGTLMLQSQMLGGGYGDIPIFNWGN